MRNKWTSKAQSINSDLYIYMYNTHGFPIVSFSQLSVYLGIGCVRKAYRAVYTISLPVTLTHQFSSHTHNVDFTHSQCTVHAVLKLRNLLDEFNFDFTLATYSIMKIIVWFNSNLIGFNSTELVSMWGLNYTIQSQLQHWSKPHNFLIASLCILTSAEKKSRRQLTLCVYTRVKRNDSKYFEVRLQSCELIFKMLIILRNIKPIDFTAVQFSTDVFLLAFWNIFSYFQSVSLWFCLLSIFFDWH